MVYPADRTALHWRGNGLGRTISTSASSMDITGRSDGIEASIHLQQKHIQSLLYLPISCLRQLAQLAIHTTTIPRYSVPRAESRAKGVQSIERNNAQGDRDRLLQADRSGNGGTAEDDRGQETELNAIGLVVLDAVTTKGVCLPLAAMAATMGLGVVLTERADGETGDDGGERARPGISDASTGRRQSGEDERRTFQTLWVFVSEAITFNTERRLLPFCEM
jgi:hypothetical protein